MALAYLFPGQGSQSIGMLSELAEKHPQIGETFLSASNALDYDLWNIVTNGPAEDLNQTHITQPAMLAAGVSVWRILREYKKETPVVMAGHSLGEYTALVCSGSLDFEDAIKLVAERGRLMQEAVPSGTGAMAAILGMDDDKVRDVCARVSGNGIVEAVNFNSPGQVVIAGNTAAVEAAITMAKESGAKRAKLLPVSVPSHCQLMKPAAEKLSLRLQQVKFSKPVIPVIHNYNVISHDNIDDIRNALTGQLYNPVRWVETIQAIAAMGAETLIECGPGKVLTGLCKRIDKNLTALPVFDIKSLAAAMEVI